MYDEEQTGLETSIAEWQRQIESRNADRLKTDQFIQLVKRYTDFSELTTPMLHEFIEKVIVHEGKGRGMTAASGRNRRQRKHCGKIQKFRFFRNADYYETPLIISV